MAVRLREADNIAAMAELQQQISELEIQVNIVFLTEIQFFETFQGFTEEVPDLSETVSCTQVQHIYIELFSDLT